MIGCKVFIQASSKIVLETINICQHEKIRLTTLTKEKIDFIFNLKLSMKQSLLSTVNISYIVEILCALS